MKKIFAVAILVMVSALLTKGAWAETFNYEAPVKYTQEAQADGGYIITLAGNLNLPDCNLYLYHQDWDRGRNVRKQKIEPFVYTVGLKKWKVDAFTIRVGQVMFNAYSPAIKAWSGIPNCLVELGPGLAFGDSKWTANGGNEGEWDKPGGTGIVLVAAETRGAQYPVSNSGCGESVRTTVPPQTYVAPTPPVQRRVIRKVPCPNGKGICSQPCIIEIKNGVEKLVASVGEPTPDEPADEKTLQQKGRLTLDSVGRIDTSDPVDERTLQQKARKTLKHTKEVHKKIGTSKRPNGTVQGTLDVIHQDIKDIKGHLNVKEGQSCASCHSDMTTSPAPAVAPPNTLRAPMPKK